MIKSDYRMVYSSALDYLSVNIDEQYWPTLRLQEANVWVHHQNIMLLAHSYNSLIGKGYPTYYVIDLTVKFQYNKLG